MSSIPDLDDLQGEEGDMKIVLPSSFDREQRTLYGIDELATLEYKLREADAHEALHSLKMVLREIAYQVSRYGKEGLSKKNNTRNVKAQKEAHAKKRLFAARYRRAREALVSLGMDDKTSELRPLTEEDMYRPSLQDPHELGSGKKTSGWIWSVGSVGKGRKDWVKEGTSLNLKRCFLVIEAIEEDRVLWFRSRAARDRWEEEVLLTQTEFGRLLQGLQAMSKIWEDLSTAIRSANMLAAAAYAARQRATYDEMHMHAQELYKKKVEPYINSDCPPIKIRRKRQSKEDEMALRGKFLPFVMSQHHSDPFITMKERKRRRLEAVRSGTNPS